MEEARSDDPGDHHGEAEVDDDLAVVTEAADPAGADEGREREARRQHREVRGELGPEQRDEDGSHALVAGATAAALGRGAFFGPRMYSSTISPMPTVMAMSATLKVGQW